MILKHKKQEKSSRYQRLREEFYLKNYLLSQCFEEISSEKYLDILFKDKGIFTLIKGSSGAEKGTVFRIPREGLYKFMSKNDIYIPYADFRNNYYHGKTIVRIRAFIVDLDNIKPIQIKQVIRYVLKTLPLPPSFIVNSGKGLHIVYGLEDPLEVRGLRWTLGKLNEKIQQSFELIAGLDKHPIVHPYRIAGFLTKIDTQATAFRTGELYNIEELKKAFQVGEKAMRGKKKERKNSIVVLPNGKRGFWEWVLFRLFKNPPIMGRRYDTFFAFGIVSYKCKREVSKEEALEAVEMILEDMKQRGLMKDFAPEEAFKAFEKGYNHKATLAPWSFLCEKFRWEYRPNKRNGRTREEHMEYLNKVIRKQQKELLKKRVLELSRREKSKTRIAEKLGISRVYVYKLLQECVN